jgi:hypothetical protein
VDNAGPSPRKRAKVAKGKGIDSGKPAGKGSKTAVASSTSAKKDRHSLSDSRMTARMTFTGSSSTSAPTEESGNSSSSSSERAQDRRSSSELRSISRMTFPGTDYARKLTLSEAFQVAEGDTLSTNQLVKSIFKMQCKSMLSYEKAIFK